MNEKTENQYQTCIITLEGGNQYQFIGPGVIPAGATIEDVQFTAPRDLPEGASFDYSEPEAN